MATQLILDTAEYNLILPESERGGYSIQREPLSKAVEMITGRTVKEVRGNVWVISYQYGWLSDEMRNKFIAVCEKGTRTPITCGFLLPDSEANDGTLEYSSFFVMDYTRPQFIWSRQVLKDGTYQPVPLWGDFNISLRQVQPDD